MRNQKTKILVEASLLVAISIVLSYVKFEAAWANGGSVTAASMAPIVILSLRHGWKWGVMGGVTHSLILTLMQGIASPPTRTLLYFAMAIALDCVIAYGVVGLASLFTKKATKLTCITATAVVMTLKLITHIISGVIVWGAYAPEGMSVLWYSTAYNCGYMIPEIIITSGMVAVLLPILNKNFTIGKSTEIAA